jgi:hypothetical protein
MTDTTAHLGRPHTIATAVACEIFDSVGGALRGIVPVLAMLKDEIMRSVCVRAQATALGAERSHCRTQCACACAVPALRSASQIGHAATPLRSPRESLGALVAHR